MLSSINYLEHAELLRSKKEAYMKLSPLQRALHPDDLDEIVFLEAMLRIMDRAVGVHHRPVGNYTPDSSIPPLHCFKEYQMALVGLEEMNMMAQSSVYEEPDWIVKEKIELQYRIEMFKQKHSLK